MTTPAIRYARTSDNSTVSYTFFKGEKPAVVGVSACGAVPQSLWSRLPALLEFHDEARDGREMYCVELRGSGLSSPLRKGPVIPQWEKDIEAVIDVTGGPVHLNSGMGACHPATALAARVPHKVLSLTLSSPLPNSLMPTVGFIPFFEADFRAAAEWHLQAFMAPGRGFPIAEIAAEWERLWSRTTFRRLADLNDTVDLRESLTRVNVPVLFMGPPTAWGEDLARTASFLPGAEIAYTSGPPIDGALGREVRDAHERFWPRVRLGDAAKAACSEVSLTRREEEVLAMLVDGKTNGKIAAELVLSEATVKTHVHRILKRPGARIAPRPLVGRSGLVWANSNCSSPCTQKLTPPR